MIQNSLKGPARGFGSLPLIGAMRFTTVDNLVGTVVHAAGLENLTYISEGRWTVNLTNDVLDVLASGLPFATLFAIATPIVADAATIPHLVQILSINQATGLITFVHLKGSALATPTYSLQDDPGIDICLLVYSLEA
jgi:hypothetical protein